MYSAKIIADSISETGKRLTTFEVTFPRIVLAEWNTHRMFSRNSASSRAIPFRKQIERVMNNPFIPERFPINCTGMQPQEYAELGTDKYNECRYEWLMARDECAKYAAHLAEEKNIHKQIANRLLEPFMWHTVICTASEFDNFFKLRTNEQAQYEIRRIADLMYDAYHAADHTWHQHQDFCAPNCQGIIINKLKVGEWHLPFISDEDYKLTQELINSKSNSRMTEEGWPIPLDLLKKISVARCARVSYLTHDGKRDIEKDLELFEKLRTSGHWSPFEHVATPYFITNTSNISQYIGDIPIVSHGLEKSRNIDLRSGNFIGWKQFRKEFSDENCTHFRKEQ